MAIIEFLPLIHKWRNRWLQFLLSLMLCVSLGAALLGAPAQAQSISPRIATKAEYALIMDYETGQILFDKNGEVPMPPASMSKLMTVAILFDMIEQGDLSLDSQFSVSEAAWRRGNGTGESKMWVLVDSKIAVRDLLRGIIIASGNDACQVVAENIAGSEQEFAKIMNRKAAEWGLTQSHFVNATGMPDPGQRMSAKDLATLTRKIIHDYPGLFPIFSEEEFTWSKITQANRNPVLKTVRGADGMKTGHTEQSGYGLVATAMQNGQRRIIVLNGLDSAAARARESTHMLEKAFSLFDQRTFFRKGEILAQADVFMGRTPTVPLTVGEDVQFLTLRAALDKARAEIVYQGPLRAPIIEGEQVAVLKLTLPGQSPLEYPLYAAQPVREVGFFKKLGFGLQSLLTPPNLEEDEA